VVTSLWTKVYFIDRGQVVLRDPMGRYVEMLLTDLQEVEGKSRPEYSDIGFCDGVCLLTRY